MTGRVCRILDACRLRICTPIPDSIIDEMAVFVEPLAAACEILDQVNINNFAKPLCSAMGSSRSLSRAYCGQRCRAW